MGFQHTFHENFKVEVAGSPGAWSAAAQASNWVQFAGVGRQATLIALAGELDANMAVAVYQATDSSGSGAKAISGLSGTFTNGTDEGGYGLITVNDDDLDTGFDYITAYVTPGAADGFAAAWVIGKLYDHPADDSDAAFTDSL